MRNRKLVTLALSAAAVPLMMAPALADTLSVSTVVALPEVNGTRSITAASLGTATNLTPGLVLSGNNALSVTVTETARTGVSPWSVTVSASDLDNTDTSDDAKIPASALTMGTTTAPSAVSCLTLAISSSRCSITNSAGGTLDQTRTLFSVSGQSTSVSYSGLYTGAATVALAVPSGLPAGTYSGTVTVTLNQ